MNNALIQLVLQYKYPLMIPAAAIEGPILMMLCGLWARLGIIDFLPAYLCLNLGDLVGDTFWYWLGAEYGHGFIRRFGRFVSITEEHVASVQKIFHRYKIWILLISKVTAGFGFALATIFTAGMSRIPYWQFILLNAAGQMVWTGILMGVGYSLGNVYLSVNNIYGKITTVALILFVMVLLFGFGKYLRKRFNV